MKFDSRIPRAPTNRVHQKEDAKAHDLSTPALIVYCYPHGYKREKNMAIKFAQSILIMYVLSSHPMTDTA